MAADYQRWDKFAKKTFDPAPDIRVGKRLIDSGEIDGIILDGTPWVDMDAWRLRKVLGEPELDLSA